MADAKAKATAEKIVEEDNRPMGWLRLIGEFMRTFESSFGDPLPNEFWQHMRSSRKEHLLAMRTLIDARIAHLEAMEEEERERKPTKITIQ